MNFQTEYEILTSLNSDEILEITFKFNSHQLKIFFTKREKQQFLILICENKQISFVKNYGIYFTSNNTAAISGYWGKYHTYAKGLENKIDKRFSEFYDKLKQAIRSIQNPNEEFEIEYLHPTEGIRKIANAQKQSALPNDSIYFHYVSRKPMRPKQFEKIKNTLGEDVAKYLKRSGLNATFTPDISKQKTFILLEQTDE
ncbi:hypothetical protein MHH70_01730 [Metasolibacillus sp. FSL H7-0170]|uniref:hypothetical protein n=1 Tax=Metasolibacillus sp. FSL H7-0170 TaxID=2921431 RepID=UPI003158DA2C